MRPLHPVVADVTARLVERSRERRSAYLARIDAAAGNGVHRMRLSCGNLAHGFAACQTDDKATLRDGVAPNLGIISAYNDMLSAHQPFERFPFLLRNAARSVGATAQLAGGVPAMCDGVTQGRTGMELSLFSREVIALSTAIALSHDMFDAALYLGVCDKIVPGLLIGALSFGHLPAVFVPAGPMSSGLPNDEKSRVRQRYAEGKATREELLEAEAQSYHGPGTCTFYGTANSNQMLMEMMGLHLPGASFVQPNTRLRDALTAEAAKRAAAITLLGDDYRPVGRIVDERAIVNGVIGLHATGGSTNHLLHLVAIAAAAGIELRLEDIEALSHVIPLLSRVYPNGSADVNHFHAAGGIAFVIGELIDAGLLHEDVETVAGSGLSRYRVEARFDENNGLAYVPATGRSEDPSVLRPVAEPFRADGGLRVLHGAFGTAAIKVSAVPEDRFVIEAPCRVFAEQHEVKQAFERGELDRDVIVVVRFQGPRANGMPELHQLTPFLSVLQKKGHRVALVTDGRMSGASGQVPAAIHVSPEAAAGGAIARLRDGDVIRLDANAGVLDVLVDASEWNARAAVTADLSASHVGMGRELFAVFRSAAGAADVGGGIFNFA
ncbi:MAG TPA: phosphogluconate dehydratase [Lysobacter sp.]|nr:phosphogluconate dehydratase [Lysobacter sp.]